jgi:hypothetical protein
MVELELLQRPEGSVANLGEGEPSLLELTRLVEGVAAGLRLPQVGERDEHDAPGGQEGAEQQREAHG